MTIAGAMGVIWSIMWFFLVYDTPSQHPRISDKEKNYIENALNKKAVKREVVKLSHYYSYSYYVPPLGMGALSDDARLTSVSLSRTTRTGDRKTNIGTGVAHVTRDSQNAAVTGWVKEKCTITNSKLIYK